MEGGYSLSAYQSALKHPGKDSGWIDGAYAHTLRAKNRL
jgi:hypothetical protein